MEYLHTMIRVTDLKATIAFFELMGFVETRRVENEKGRYHAGLPRRLRRRRAGAQRAGAADRTHLELGPGGLYRRAQLRSSRLSRRRHLCDLQKAHGRRRDHQPPAARRQHGLHPHAGQYLDRASPERSRACARRTLGVDAEHWGVVRAQRPRRSTDAISRGWSDSGVVVRPPVASTQEVASVHR